MKMNITKQNKKVAFILTLPTIFNRLQAQIGLDTSPELFCFFLCRLTDPFSDRNGCLYEKGCQPLF